MGRKELSWTVETEDALMMPGDPEQWSKLLENILENQIRYAETAIHIRISQNQQQIVMTVKNDGLRLRMRCYPACTSLLIKGRKASSA